MGELADDRQRRRLVASKPEAIRLGTEERRRWGVLVLLVANEDAAAEVGARVAQELATLGVTSVSVLRDEQTTAVALEGWAFDIDRSAEAAVRAVAADPARVRVLRPIVESAVHPPFTPVTAKGTR